MLNWIILCLLIIVESTNLYNMLEAIYLFDEISGDIKSKEEGLNLMIHLNAQDLAINRYITELNNRKEDMFKQKVKVIYFIIVNVINVILMVLVLCNCIL